MVSSVTTTILILANSALALSFAIIGIVVLLLLLVVKELAPAPNYRFQNISKILNIGIIPLFIAFVSILIVNVIHVFK